MDNKNAKYIVIASVLLLLSAYFAFFSGGDVVDETLTNATTQYNCPHCQHLFDMTMASASEAIRAGGITCPSCGKKINDTATASVENRKLRQEREENFTSDEPAPPRPRGGLNIKGR